MKYVRLVGGSDVARAALTMTLGDEGIEAVTGSNVDPPNTVVIHHCASQDDWTRLTNHYDDYLARVAVIDNLEIELYRRALAHGFGVVHQDMSADIVVSVARAASQGEALIPAQIARFVAMAGEPAEQSAPELDPLEVKLLKSLALGDTVVAFADRTFYSERTIRRRLQSACLKLGASDRRAAIRTATRLGML